MLYRRNSVPLHQPIMPFKWRPFDLYNNIHIDADQCIGDDHRQTIADNCPYQNSDICHMTQPPAGSSSDSSCNSISTATHSVANSDNIHCMDAMHGENYRQLFCQRDFTSNLKCPSTRCTSAASYSHSIDTDVNCCCGTVFRNISRICLDNSHKTNHSVKMHAKRNDLRNQSQFVNNVLPFYDAQLLNAIENELIDPQIDDSSGSEMKSINDTDGSLSNCK